MIPTWNLDTVRGFVRQRLTEIGLSPLERSCEAVANHDGRACGFWLLFDEAHVVWLVSGNRVEFYSPDGQFIELVRLDGLGLRKAG